MTNKNLIILRGLPGSGKTSIAELIGKAICSADDFLMRDGEYKWSPNSIHASHKWCQRKAELFMKRSVDKVIICNTSTTEKELKPYIDLGNKYGYKIFCLIVENRHGNISIHNVPDQTLEKMRNRFNIKL